MTAIVVRQTNGFMRAFDGDTVVAIAARSKGGHGDEWPAGWTVTFSVPTREQALAILRKQAHPPEREPFDVDYFPEDLGERPPLPLVHRIVATGEDGNGGWYAECACEWKCTGYFSAAVLAMAVDEHLHPYPQAVPS